MRTEYMGVFGFSWQEKVLSRMKKIVDTEFRNKITVKSVNALHAVYMVVGDKQSTKEVIAERSGVDENIAFAFLLALKDSALTGEIPFKYYDPGTIKASEKVKADLLTPAPVKEMKKYIGVAAALTAGFLLVKIMSLNPLKRS